MGIITEQSVKNQLKKWVLGCPWHDPLVGEKVQRWRTEDQPGGNRGFTQGVMGHKEG